MKESTLSLGKVKSAADDLLYFEWFVGWNLCHSR